MKQLRMFLTVAFAYVLGDQVGRWRMHSKLEHKISAAQRASKVTMSEEVRDALSDWMWDDQDHRSFDDMMKELGPVSNWFSQN
jgi:hypothetical protein